MATLVALTIVSIGLTYLAARLFAPKAPKAPLDTSTTTLADRGSSVPLILGRVRTGYVFCWAGDRYVQQVSAGGGKGGGGSSPKKSVYHESGWHTICVGPARKLHRIRRGSANVGGVSYPLDRDSDPSGSSFSSKHGSFDVYWGECDQPSNSHLGSASRVGITSMWPYFCYVLWRPHILGEGSARWPLLDYEVEVRVEGSALTDSAAWLDESTSGAGDDGVNPAHALWQLLTATYPHGMALDPQRFDKQSFEDLGVLCESEQLALNIRAGDAAEAVQVIADILQHIGVMMPQIADQLVAVSVRAVAGTVPVLNSDVIQGRPIEREVNIQRTADRVVFSYPDRKNLYKAMDYLVDDDSVDLLSRTEQRVELRFVTSKKVAETIIDRRQAEIYADLSASAMRVAREGRRMEPGQVFELDGDNQRVVAVKLEPDPAFAVIEFVPDLLSPASTGLSLTERDPSADLPTIDVADEIAFRPIELSWRMAPVEIQTIGVLRFRGDLFVEGAVVNVSPDGVSYADIGANTNTHHGGTLLDAISRYDPQIIDEGPRITLESLAADVANVLDLSGDEARWRSGAQLLFIGGELFYLQSITALGGSTYRLDGLIRARHDTIREQHAIGARAWIVPATALSAFFGEAIERDVALRVKSQPYNAAGIDDLSTITEETVTIVERALRPIAPTNFRANDRLVDGRRNVYDSGDDIDLAWTHRVRNGAGAAAGEILAGSAVFAQAGVEGFIRITIEELDGTVVRTIDITDGAIAETYTNAQMVTDFGGEPVAFVARIRNLNGARSSDDVALVISQAPGVDLLVDSAGDFLADSVGDVLED